MFVIAAMLLSIAPAHAHTILAAVLPANAPPRQVAAAERVAVRDAVKVKRAEPSVVPAPAFVLAGRVLIAVRPVSVTPAVQMRDAAVLAHAPNAP